MRRVFGKLTIINSCIFAEKLLWALVIATNIEGAPRKPFYNVLGVPGGSSLADALFSINLLWADNEELLAHLRHLKQSPCFEEQSNIGRALIITSFSVVGASTWLEST